MYASLNVRCSVVLAIIVTLCYGVTSNTPSAINRAQHSSVWVLCVTLRRQQHNVITLAKSPDVDLGMLEVITYVYGKRLT